MDKNPVKTSLREAPKPIPIEEFIGPPCVPDVVSSVRDFDQKKLEQTP